ncbi:glycoside hydrolase family 99-like domain-containing protein [Methyloversatilis sp.]|uniref:glycoside hydrolase family 99-like domain-containing protein n=1 Tax=Methyloversatilis sp. TaxID=2569862 RepID=UPI0035B331A6
MKPGLCKDCLRACVVLALSLLGCTTGGQPAIARDVTPGYNIGVYYFPGWKDDERGLRSPRPWDAIKAYPEREPLLGWYRDGDPKVMETQIGWMADHGIDFVVFDWYWDGQTFAEHALSAYMQAANRDRVDFSILWANHNTSPKNLDEFDRMVRYWVKYYFPRKEFMKIDGKPVVFIVSQQKLIENAGKLGMEARDLIARAKSAAQTAGFDGIYFVASAEAVDFWIRQEGPKGGYSAFSTYNYHRGFSGQFIPDKPLSRSYRELDAAYQESWDWILKHSPIDYILPTTAGWDKRPWGGSADPAHDGSSSTPEQFRAHLRSARERLDRYPEKTRRTTVICCWNEFGEGSYIEPTKSQGRAYLEAIDSVFSD